MTSIDMSPNARRRLAISTPGSMQGGQEVRILSEVIRDQCPEMLDDGTSDLSFALTLESKAPIREAGFLLAMLHYLYLGGQRPDVSIAQLATAAKAVQSGTRDRLHAMPTRLMIAQGHQDRRLHLCIHPTDPRSRLRPDGGRNLTLYVTYGFSYAETLLAWAADYQVPSITQEELRAGRAKPGGTLYLHAGDQQGAPLHVCVRGGPDPDRTANLSRLPGYARLLHEERATLPDLETAVQLAVTHQLHVDSTTLQVPAPHLPDAATLILKNLLQARRQP